jgi:GR25 family glycosyltransferase involved in LPS biosynthesis
MQKLRNDIHINMSSMPENYSNISLPDIFDKVYVISLPKRREYILESLRSFGEYPEIIEAIWKDDIPFEQMSDDFNFKNAGEMACTMSHFKALQTFLSDKDAQTAVIFEDDVSPCKDEMKYIRRLNSLRNELKRVPEWDILYLGHCYSTCSSIKFITEQISKYTGCYCLHAYVVNRKGAQKILDLGCEEISDRCFKSIIANGHLKALQVFPSLFHQNRKDVGSELRGEQEMRECGGSPGFF